MSDGKVLLFRLKEKIVTALVRHNRLLSLNINDTEVTTMVGNIYIGKVQNIQSDIRAAFIEIQKGILCYLSLADVKQPVHIGDEIVVQVNRDGVKTKLPSVTTNISLSGSYLVINNSKTGKVGISNKLSVMQKNEIQNYLDEQNLQTEYDVVIRTNAGALDADYSFLKDEWERLHLEMNRINEVSSYRTCYTVLKQTGPGYINAVCGFYRDEYDEIITDEKDIFESLGQILKEQGNLTPVRLYQDDMLPLVKLYSMESKIKEVLGSRIWLKSGGYLVVEHTEAMTVIDVNTGKYDEKKGNPQKTFKKINMEAAKEIALQLRLRNISGIIIVDFINMQSEEARNELMEELRRYLKNDVVKANVIDMTALGLVEITRKKINKPLREQLQGVFIG